MSREGFIKIHRKICEWEFYSNADMLRVFLHLIAKASYYKNSFQGIEIDRGQLVISRLSISEDLKISERKVRTTLRKLEDAKQITRRIASKYTIITICNYAKYQDYREKKDVKTSDQINDQNLDQLSDQINDQNNTDINYSLTNTYSNDIKISDQINSQINDQIKAGKATLLKEEKEEKEFINTKNGVFKSENALDITILINDPDKLTAKEIIERQKKIWEEAMASQVWIESNMRALKLTEKEVKDLLVIFLKDLYAKDDFYKPFSEVKRHFANWARKYNTQQIRAV